jgi:UDP-N-acetylmuramyl tripeptide synthase
MTALAPKLAAARAVGALARRAGRGGGTSLPGKVLMRLEPHAIAELAARLQQGSVVISATNGKTTTAAMAASILMQSGIPLVHNRAGANMAGGVASTLLDAARRGGSIDGELGLFEVDEFWLPQLTRELQPRAMLLGNLFRDQLDRYGELDAIADRWAEVVVGAETVGCGRTRPQPTVSATSITLAGTRRATFELRTAGGVRTVELPLPGLYNVYNALGAAALCLRLGVELDVVVAGLEAVTAAFGRAETIELGDVELSILLVKNPAGANEILRTLALEPGELDVLAVLNDNMADGRDVSWVWDADFELLARRVRRVTCAGTRAAELAVRLNYAGVPRERLHVVAGLPDALDAALADVAHGRLFALPTYTALLELRRELSERGQAPQFWDR